MNVKELREKLGLKEGQLLTNTAGELADILAVNGDTVTLGVLSLTKPIEVPLDHLLRSAPKKSHP